MDELFGNVVYQYTRADAIDDGVLVDVSTMSKEAGIKYPVCMSIDSYTQYVACEENTGDGQSVDGRLWDVLYMMRVAMQGGPNVVRVIDKSTLIFQLYVVNQAKGEQELVELKGMCHPGDEGEPVITIMMPNED